jgi:hypothetical protein
MTLVLMGCDGSDTIAAGPTPTDAAQDGSESPSPVVTYHQDIQPLMDRACVKCHHEGGSTPFRLTTWDDVRLRAHPIVDAVLTRKMPPAQADPDCRPMTGGNWMTQEELETFEQWAADGYQEGVPVDRPTMSARSDPMDHLGPPNIVIRMPEPYTPTWNSEGDDIIYIDLGYVASEDIFVSATRVVPSAPEIAHHGIASALLPWLDWVHDDRNDGAEGGTLGGYVPGMTGFILPEGTAFLVPKNTPLQLQMHYHRGALDQNEPTPSDQTEVHLWTLPVDEVSKRARLRFLAIRDLLIEADDPHSVQEADFPMSEFPTTIFGIIPHMHFLGVQFRLEATRLDGSTECLLYEPAYDFHWQTLHRFADASLVSLDGGERATLTCVYDNSQENQPFVDGRQLRTRDVTLGPSSLDEMCVTWIFESVPHPFP